MTAPQGYLGSTSPPPPNHQHGSSNPYLAQYRLSTADASDWKHTTDRISTFVEKGSQDETQIPSEPDISRSHWVKNGERISCSNSKCKKKFTLTQRKHHCRRCGDVFCRSCLRWRCHLSHLGEYDPSGKIYQVCENCYNSDTQTIGFSRHWTALFQKDRRRHQATTNLNSLTEGNLTKTILQQECDRLIDGYGRNYLSMIPTSPNDHPDNSKPKPGFFRRLTPKISTRSIKGIPEWQKPQTWMNEGSECKICLHTYTRLEKYHNCRICGRLVCLSCSDKNLLLYVPDECDRERLGNQPKWAIIAIVGCPEVEPDKHLYLRVCFQCREKLETLQVDAYQEFLRESDDTVDCMAKMVHMHKNIVNVQVKLDTSLPEYKQVIDGMEIEPESPKSLPSQRSNMQALAKHQGDLSDNFTKFVVMVGRLKKLKPQTSTQLKLVKSLISCKFGFYSENMYNFRQLKKRLAQISPPEVLEEIQHMVDSEAINSTCLGIGQLAFESLHLCSKYGVEDRLSLALAIKEAAEVCEQDLQANVEMRGRESWQEHKQRLDTFIKTQLKEKERWYLRPSRRQSHHLGKFYVSDFLPNRCAEVVSGISLQLRTRCADSRFEKSKLALTELKDALEAAKGKGQ